MIFRFDDISRNTDINKLSEMVDIVEPFVDKIYICISPLYHFIPDEPERVFPAIFKAYSDFKCFYDVNYALYPFDLPCNIIKNKKVTIASHGLLHVDHRLLTYQSQEMSILTSASLTKSKVFVPPFNKYNQDSERICKEAGIVLIRFEDGWKSVECNAFDKKHDKWYLHSWRWNIDNFKKWVQI